MIFIPNAFALLTTYYFVFDAVINVFDAVVNIFDAVANVFDGVENKMRWQLFSKRMAAKSYSLVMNLNLTALPSI